MASTELFARLETRAVTAEKLIAFLKNEVEVLTKLHDQRAYMSKVQQLQRENEDLRKEIEQWKTKLINLETANGIKQVPSPKVTNVNPETQSSPPTEVSHSETPVQPSKEVKLEKADKKKKEKTASANKKGKSSGDCSNANEEAPVDVGRLDLRVGRIVSVKKHPDADSLYVEEVELGEDKCRTVVSGLVKHVSLEEMQNRMVVVLCNLKPAKMRGVTSEAMVMCASSPEKVEILIPPVGSLPGDEVHVEGFPRVPDPVLNPKKKIFETVAPDLKTNEDKVATYKGVVWNVPGKGVVSAPSLVGVNIK